MKIYIPLIFLLLLLGGCQPKSTVSEGGIKPKDEILTVSAAVSLKDAFNEIGGLYKSKTGRTINFNFGASGALQRQIETGAPVDVFASAGAQQMNELAAKNLIDQATRRDFARNTLVLIVPTDSEISLASFSDLNKPEVQKIAVGNPKTVPAGQYAAEFFDKANLKNGLESKLISAEDVRQVLDYVVRGEVDAGIVYGSDAFSAGATVKVAATAPEDSHAPILYPIAVIKDSKQIESTQELINLVLSAEGQNIMRQYGFLNAAEK